MPVVAVNDVGGEADFFAQLKRGAREKDEPVVVVEEPLTVGFVV